MFTRREIKLRQYCRDDMESIENYEQAKQDGFVGWHIHHRLELTLDGEPVLTSSDLKRFGMYYHRPYYELIFLRTSEHRLLHKHHTAESCAKISARHVGMRGKHHSDESKAKMSEATKLMMKDESVRAHRGDFCRGKHWNLINGRRVYYV